MFCFTSSICCTHMYMKSNAYAYFRLLFVYLSVLSRASHFSFFPLFFLIVFLHATKTASGCICPSSKRRSASSTSCSQAYRMTKPRLPTPPTQICRLSCCSPPLPRTVSWRRPACRRWDKSQKPQRLLAESAPLLRPITITLQRTLPLLRTAVPAAITAVVLLREKR